MLYLWQIKSGSKTGRVKDGAFTGLQCYYARSYNPRYGKKFSRTGPWISGLNILIFGFTDRFDVLILEWKLWNIIDVIGVSYEYIVTIYSLIPFLRLCIISGTIV